jgi:hypothetical protein
VPRSGGALMKPGAKRPGWVRRIFRQPGGPHDPQHRSSRTAAHRGRGSRGAEHEPALPPAAEERRIRFVRIGPRHVRIPESALREFIEARLVEPVTTRNRRKVA